MIEMNAHDAAPKGDATKTAVLTLNGKPSPMPVRSGSVGPDVIDVTRVYRDTGFRNHLAG